MLWFPRNSQCQRWIRTPVGATHRVPSPKHEREQPQANHQPPTSVCTLYGAITGNVQRNDPLRLRSILPICPAACESFEMTSSSSCKRLLWFSGHETSTSALPDGHELYWSVVVLSQSCNAHRLYYSRVLHRPCGNAAMARCPIIRPTSPQTRHTSKCLDRDEAVSPNKQCIFHC